MNERNDKFNQELHVCQQSACANILLETAAVSILIALHYSCHRQTASGSFISTCFLIPVAMFCLTPLKSAELQSCESFIYTPRRGQNGSVLSADGEIFQVASALHIPFFTAAINSRFLRNLPRP
jgi:hypothetical protein